MASVNSSVSKKITLTGTHLTGRESAYVQDAIARGFPRSGGHYTDTCEKFLENHLAVPKVFLTSSCSSALHLAGVALGLDHDSEIIIPSYTFASCASVFQSLGVNIVFADSRLDTMNIDEKQIEQLISPRTRAILVVHYAGVSCEMEPLLKVAKKHRIYIIEDAAHGQFGTYCGKPLGSIGALGVFSFDFQKNITCGEGGALVVNDPTLLNATEIAYHRGTNRSQFIRGVVDKFEWFGSGGNYSPSELQAAFLLGQFEGAVYIQQRRKEIVNEYEYHLRDWAMDNEVRLPICPTDCCSAFHIFYLLLKTPADRSLLIEHLAARAIPSAFHYLPLHLAPASGNFKVVPCDVAEDISAKLLRLPLHPGMTDEDVQQIIAGVTAFSCEKDVRS